MILRVRQWGSPVLERINETKTDRRWENDFKNVPVTTDQKFSDTTHLKIRQTKLRRDATRRTLHYEDPCLPNEHSIILKCRDRLNFVKPRILVLNTPFLKAFGKERCQFGRILEEVGLDDGTWAN